MERATCKNLSHFVKNNPPLTLITICILCLAVITYSFAFYARHKNYLLNTDILMDTYQLKKYINDLKSCIKPSNNIMGDHTVLKRNIDNNEQLIVTALISLKNINDINSNISQVHGLITLEKFRWGCQQVTYPSYLEVGFSLSDKIQDKICIQISGPQNILKNLLTTKCQSNYRYQSTDGLLQTTSRSYGPFCNNGTEVHFNFERRENSDKFDVHITKEEQASIETSLLWCTYILVVIFLLIVVIVIFYNDSSLEKVDLSF